MALSHIAYAGKDIRILLESKISSFQCSKYLYDVAEGEKGGGVAFVHTIQQEQVKVPDTCII